MRYNYKSSGILSRIIFEHKDETVASQSNTVVTEYNYKQALTQRVEEANYGTVGDYGSEGIGSNTTDGKGGILIVGEPGKSFISGSANVILRRKPVTGQQQGPGGTTIYSYESGLIAETVGLHGPSTISFLGARRLSSFTFIFDTWQSISRFVGAAECTAKVYEPDFVEEFNTIDYGLISSNHTSTIDNGLITVSTSVGEDRGRILDGVQTRFGFKKIIGEAQARATNAWRGEGRLIAFGKQDSPGLYGYIADGKVRIFGSADTSFTTPTLGGGLTPLSGTAIIGITVITSGDGSFKKFGGSAESATFNPQERDLLFSFTGGLTSEKHTESWLGSGQLRNFAKLEKERSTFGYAGSGSFTFQPENAIEKNTESYNQSAVVRFARVDYGTLVDTNLTNCVLESGTISTDTTATSGCIKIAPGTTLAVAPSNTYTIPSQITTPSSYVDYGNVADSASAVIDHGHILDNSDLVPYGLFKLKSITDVAVKQRHVYIGSEAKLRIFGGAFLPLDANVIATGSLFAIGGAAECTGTDTVGSGIGRISGNAVIGIGLSHIGSGSLRKLGGLVESSTFNPLEKQMLFSFTGGLTSEKHTETYVGSGSLRNFATIEAEKGTFDYVGSGNIKLRPRKPQTYELGELGSFTLEYYSLYNGYINLGNIDFFDRADSKIGYTQLKWLNLEESHEKHTEAYNNSACIDAVDLDYGNLVEQNLLNCVLDSGTISTNTTASSGCIKIAPNTTLTVAPGSTYTIPNQLTVPSSTEDYGLVTDISSAANRDYGHILGTLSKVCPFGAGRIIGVAKTHVVENIILSGYSVTGKAGVTLFGDAATFWTPPFFGRGETRITGTLHESFTSDYIGSGTIFVTGDADTVRARDIVGSGSLRKLSGAAESLTFNPTEEQMLFSFTGKCTEKHTESYVGSGSTTLSGIVGESFTPATHIGSGSLRKLSGAAESTSIGAVAGGLFKIGSEAYVLFSLLHPASGITKVTGVGAESTLSEHTGSGSLRKLSGAAESATFNPLERQMLFSFTGVGGEVFTANPPEEEAKVRIFGEHIVRATNAEQPFGRIPVFGEASVPRTRFYIGSGTFKKFSGAAESITFNPLEKQMLFSFSGVGTEIFSANPPEETVELRLRGTTEPEILTFAEQPFGRIPVSGEASVPRTKVYIGSGTFKKFSGAAESLTFNPLERQLLFSFTGTGSENTVASPPKGDGRLFTFNSSTVVSAVAHETTGLFKVSGVSVNVRSISYIGSGTFKKFSGAAESLTFNPTEEQMLFSFTGQGSDATSSVEVGSGGFKIYPEASDIRFVPNWNSVGGLKVYVDGAYRYCPVWIGSGTLKKFSGAAESLTFNPTEEQMLFSFTGQSSESRLAREISKGGTVKLSGIVRDVFVPNNIGSGTIFVTGDADAVRARDFVGSGSLRKLSGAAESRRIDITTLPSLFRVYGDGDIARSRPYIGSGSLRKLSGAAESITFNPDEKQMLFSFLGQATTTRARDKVGQGTVKTLGDSIARFSPVHIGSGTTRISGNATVVRARDFVGFGSLRKLSGAAEALTFNPLEKQMLFSFTGVGADSRTSKLLSQGGTLAVRGTSGDPLLTFAEQPRVEIDITGDSIDLRAHAYQGSGRISNVNNADDAYIRAPYRGSGNVRISGNALIQVQLFQPAFTQVWII